MRNRGSSSLILAIAFTSIGYTGLPSTSEAATIHMPYMCQTGPGFHTRVTGAAAEALGCKPTDPDDSSARWMFPYDNGRLPVVADEAYTAVNINKSSCYMPGEDIDVTATGWVKAKCGNGAPGWVDVTVGGDTQRLVSYTPPHSGTGYTTEDFTPGFGTFTAPSEPGDYFLETVLVNTHGGVMSRRAQIPYSVCQPANVDATCGTARGGNFQTAPTTNLCGQGEGVSSGPVKASDSNQWTWTCAGTGTGSDAVCSTNTCNSNYGTSCTSNANACGATNTGVYNCSGQCVNSLAGNVPIDSPDVSVTHPFFGETKTSPANACGARNVSRGSCTGPAPDPVAPSGASCPVGPTVCVTDDDGSTAIPSSLPVPSGGVIRPTAIAEDGTVTNLGEPFRIEGGGSTYKVGDKCLVSNPACPGQAANESYVTCDGTCAVAQPVCGGVQCISRGNVEGKTNVVYVENAQQCIDLAVVPSDSVCEIPSFGFRTKNGLYTVDPGTEKTLVWDTVLNATSCTVQRADGQTLAVINNHIRDTSRPQPGHSWTNILPSGEVETGEINQTTEYIMTCINVDSPEVTERLRITLTPNVIEN